MTPQATHWSIRSRDKSPAPLSLVRAGLSLVWTRPPRSHPCGAEDGGAAWLARAQALGAFPSQGKHGEELGAGCRREEGTEYFCILTLTEVQIRVPAASVRVGAGSAELSELLAQRGQRGCGPGSQRRLPPPRRAGPASRRAPPQRGAATRRRRAHGRFSFIVLTEHPQPASLGSCSSFLLLLRFLLHLGGQAHLSAAG